MYLLLAPMDWNDELNPILLSPVSKLFFLPSKNSHYKLVWTRQRVLHKFSSWAYRLGRPLKRTSLQCNRGKWFDRRPHFLRHPFCAQSASPNFLLLPIQQLRPTGAAEHQGELGIPTPILRLSRLQWCPNRWWVQPPQRATGDLQDQPHKTIISKQINIYYDPF